jgi:hypothetical protein
MPADAEERFLLKYEGDALVDHSIDVTDLAPALLGLSELVDEANHVINNDRTYHLELRQLSLGASKLKFTRSKA